MNRLIKASRSWTARLAFKVHAKKILIKKLILALVERCWTLVKDSTNKYHREQHYMRGPGPKWHAKHAHYIARPS